MILQKYNFHTIATVVFALLLIGSFGQGVWLPIPFILIFGAMFTKWGWAWFNAQIKGPSWVEENKRYAFLIAAFVCGMAIGASPTHQRKQAANEAARAAMKQERDSIRAADEAERKRLEAGKEWQEKNLGTYKGIFAADGRCGELCALVKQGMHDPGSFDHVKTEKVKEADHYAVTMAYRGKNRFGALVLEQVTADVYPNGGVANVRKVGD